MEKYSKWIESTLFRIKRRHQYVKYCYSALTSNVYHEPTVDVILEQLLVPIGKLSEKTIVKIALLFVPLVHFMVLCVAYIYLIEFNEFWSWFQKIFGSYLLLQILFNYNFACFTSPGYIINDVYACNSVKTCAKCNLPKPPRAHHCSSCHKCVLLMDHHCPWIHNCVGLFNRRYFFNFCLFTTIGLYFVAISLLPYYISLKQHYNPSSLPWLWFQKSSIAENMSEHQERRTDLVFAFCCLVILPLSFLTLFHIYLISTGQTTIERLQNKKNSESKILIGQYDHGIIKNWSNFYTLRDKKDIIFRIILPSLHRPRNTAINRAYDV